MTFLGRFARKSPSPRAAPWCILIRHPGVESAAMAPPSCVTSPIGCPLLPLLGAWGEILCSTRLFLILARGKHFGPARRGLHLTGGRAGLTGRSVRFSFVCGLCCGWESEECGCECDSCDSHHHLVSGMYLHSARARSVGPENGRDMDSFRQNKRRVQPVGTLARSARSMDIPGKRAEAWGRSTHSAAPHGVRRTSRSSHTSGTAQAAASVKR